jgi:GGDEF domain-containing protein
MFIRKKPNKSGSISVQIIEKQGRHNRVIESIGCSSDPAEIDRLYEQAYARMYTLRHQPNLPLDDASKS